MLDESGRALPSQSQRVAAATVAILKMPTVTQAVRRFLTAQKTKHNGPDLLERYLALDGMETQICVHRGDGEPVDGKSNTYSDGVRTWGPIRIPWKANSVPEWRDYHLSWPLHEYVDAIGSTGWNYLTRTSLYVAFDFDGMTHGAGLTEQQLNEVRQAASELQYVEVRRSSGGSGYHFYVMLDLIPTANHTEHAALAKRVLKKMSCDAKFDFASRVDVCGGNFWFYHRKATKENQGFSLIKAAA